MKLLSTFMTLTLSLILTVPLLAQQDISYKNSYDTKPLKQNKIKKMDQRLTKYKTVKRDFRNPREFKRLQRNYKQHPKHFYNNGLHIPNKKYYDHRSPITKQRGYRHSKRGWELVYLYDRASFYDRYGYYYGYFNRYGYYFENVFYRYDRFYTYRDRLKGKGLFERRYYMPANARYYGFCETRRY